VTAIDYKYLDIGISVGSLPFVETLLDDNDYRPDLDFYDVS